MWPLAVSCIYFHHSCGLRLIFFIFNALIKNCTNQPKLIWSIASRHCCITFFFSYNFPEGKSQLRTPAAPRLKTTLSSFRNAPQRDKARRTPPASLCNHWPTFSSKWAAEQECLKSDLLVSSHFHSAVLRGLPWQPCEVHINCGPGAVRSRSAKLMKLHCVHHTALFSNKQPINTHIHQLQDLMMFTGGN